MSRLSGYTGTHIHSHGYFRYIIIRFGHTVPAGLARALRLQQRDLFGHTGQRSIMLISKVTQYVYAQRFVLFFSSCRRYEMLMWWKWTNPRWPQRKGEFSIFLFEDKHVHFHSHTRCCDTCACVSVWKLLSQNHLLTNSPSLLIFTLRDGTLWATRCLSLQFVILSHYQCVKERVCATQQIISRPGVKKPPRVFVMTTKNNNSHHWNQAWNKPLVYLSLSGLHI